MCRSQKAINAPPPRSLQELRTSPASALSGGRSLSRIDRWTGSLAGLNGRAVGRRFVLRCAFGLDLFRKERAVGLYATLHERLRAIFERVWQRVIAPIAYRQSLPLFFQHEIDAA